MNIPSGEQQADPMQHEIAETLRSLTHKGLIPTAEDLSDGERLKAALLRLAEGSIQTELQAAKTAVDRLSARAVRPESLTALQAAQRLLSGQELLSRLTPLLHTLGEPALMLCPCLLEGFLAHWEVAIDPEARSAHEVTSAFQRLRLFLPFPQLGPIAVEIALRGKEAYLKFIAEEAPVTAELRQKLPLLEEKLNALEYTVPILTAEQGAAHEAAPQWYLDMTQKNILA